MTRDIRSCWILFVSVCCAAAGTCVWSDDAQSPPAHKARTRSVAAKGEFVVATYPVADLVIPPRAFSAPAVGAPSQNSAHDVCAQPLMDHLQRTIATQSWEEHGGSGMMKFYSQTHALVVRQSSEIHEQLAEEIQKLRRKLDCQVVLEFRTVTASHRDVDQILPKLRAALSERRGEQVDGLLGPTGVALENDERNLLQDMVTQQIKPGIVQGPKVTLFAEQVATVSFDSWHFVMAATLTSDNRTITLRLADHGDDPQKVVARTQTLELPSGRTRLVRFIGESAFPGVLPIAPDSQEQLVFVTASAISTPEEEELLPATDAVSFRAK